VSNLPLCRLSPTTDAKHTRPTSGNPVPAASMLYPLCETNWRHDPRSRSVVFINADPAGRSPRVMAFPDCREPPPKKP
jgi:hypothetical protein